MEKLLVEVTEEDISNGVRRSCESCPIALAVRRIKPDVEVEVGPYSIAVDGVWADLPGLCRNFLRNFDDGYKVEPIDFMLDLTNEEEDED